MRPQSIGLPAGWKYRRISHGSKPDGVSASVTGVFADTRVAIAIRERAP